MQARKPVDFLIIGGGIIGLATAYELAQAGAQVSILEQGTFGGESSWAGGGILSPLYPWRYASEVLSLAQWSQQFYPQWIYQLSHATGIDPEYQTCGQLILDVSCWEQETSIIHQWSHQYEQPFAWLEENELSARMPFLNLTQQRALWLPEVAQVRNPRLLAALLNWLKMQTRVSLHDQQLQLQLKRQKRRVVVTVAKEEIVTDQVIIAAGAWSGRLLQSIQLELEVQPICGQMILLQGQQTELLNRIVMCDGQYLIPRINGKVLVGSTLENTHFEKRTTTVARKQLQAFAASICPALKHAKVKAHWAGLRPGSSTGIPYIGPVDDFDNLWLNTGHFRNGLTLAPASAKLLVDLLLNRNPILSPKLYQWSLMSKTLI